MKKSKLLSILNSLNKAEMKAFYYFLSCKLFNKRDGAIRLFDYLKVELTTSNPRLKKEEVFCQLFPNEPFRDKTIRDLMYQLIIPLNRFLAWQKLYENEGDELIALCKAYRERNMSKLFNSTVTKTAEAQQNSWLRDSEYHHRNYLLQKELYYASTQKGRGHMTNLKEVTASLDINYFANRLRESCYMLSHQNTYNITYDFTLVEDIIKEIDRQDLLHIPAISIYYYCFLAQRHQNQHEYFKLLRNNLVAHTSQFTVAEMKDIYLLAINIAIKTYNQGSTKLISDLLELYRSGVEQKILLTNNVLSRFTYKNMIALALYTNKFDWAAEIMDSYTPLLDPAYREDSYQYNLAKFHYSKGEYGDALQLLFLLVSSDDVYTNISTKILLSRIYYEQGDLDALNVLIESFRKTLTRKKEILGYRHMIYKNFLKYVNKLMLLNMYDNSAKKSLLEEIKDVQPLPDKYWFLNQLN